MRAFRSLSAWFARLEPRERRVVAGGAAISVAALLTVLVVLPFARRWSERADAIAAKREQLTRLRALVEGEASARATVEAGQRAQQARATRLLAGETPDVAASALQELVQGYATEADVALSSFNADRVTSDSTLQMIPIRLAGESDVAGLTRLLYDLQHGEKLLLIDEMRINARTPDADGVQMLAWSLRLRAPFVTE